MTHLSKVKKAELLLKGHCPECFINQREPGAKLCGACSILEYAINVLRQEIDAEIIASILGRLNDVGASND